MQFRGPKALGNRPHGDGLSCQEPAESSATGRAGLNRSVAPSGPRSLISLPLRVKRAALKNKVLDRESQTSRLEFLPFPAIFHPSTNQSTHYMWGSRFRLPTRYVLPQKASPLASRSH